MAEEGSGVDVDTCCLVWGACRAAMLIVGLVRVGVEVCESEEVDRLACCA